MTFDEYVALAHKRYISKAGSERMGQSYMNFLAEHRPEIANKITGTGVDPFYSEDVPFNFLLAVSVLW